MRALTGLRGCSLPVSLSRTQRRPNSSTIAGSATGGSSRVQCAAGGGHASAPRGPSQQRRCVQALAGSGAADPASAAAAAEDDAEAKLAAFEEAFGGISRTAILQLLSRAPPAVCSFNADTLELTLASLEAALGYPRQLVLQLVRLDPSVLVSPQGPGAVLRALTQLLQLPRGMVAANLRTRLHILALTEEELRQRCAALGRLLRCHECGGAGGGGGGTSGVLADLPNPSSSSSSSSGKSSSSNSPWAQLGASPDAGDAAAFAAFASTHPGQALALVAHHQKTVAERMDACCEALDDAPVSAVAALARARPLMLELSEAVLRSRAMVLAEAAFLDEELQQQQQSGAAAAEGPAGDTTSDAWGGRREAVLDSSGSRVLQGAGSQREADRREHSRWHTRPRPLADLLATLDGEELEGMADRLLLAPHSLHLWLQQLRGLLPDLPPLGLVRLLLRLKVRPQEVHVRWQALQLATRGSEEWEAQLGAAAVEDLADLLSAPMDALARMRYLSSTDRRGEATLLEALRYPPGEFAQRFPGYMSWIGCGG